MSTATSAPAPQRSRRALWTACAVAIVVAVAFLVWRNGSSDDDSAVPPLTAAERAAGVVRLTYPDRTLPEEPEVVTVGGERITLFFGSVTQSDGNVSATLGIVTPRSTPPGIRDDVTIAEGATKVVDGYAITLLDAYPTGNPKTEAADVSVAGGTNG